MIAKKNWMDLLRKANKELPLEQQRKWLAYCFGVIVNKMDKKDFDTMAEGIKKYKVK